jgi:hypothetical protein
MYGEWVTLNMGEAVEAKVFVLCTDTTPEDKKQRLAKALLQTVMDANRRSSLSMDERHERRMIAR